MITGNNVSERGNRDRENGMKNIGIKLFPSGLVSCFVNGLEARITELSDRGMIVRLSDKCNKIESLRVHVYHFEENQYDELTIEQFECIEEENDRFAYYYNIDIEDREYRDSIQHVFIDYSSYTNQKLNGGDTFCSEERVSYPGKLDLEFENNYSDLIQKWGREVRERYKKVKQENTNTEFEKMDVEVAVALQSNELNELYLKTDPDEFQRLYSKKYYMEWHPLFHIPFTRIYIGNQFCHNLFPKQEMLMKLLEKALQEGFAITLVFTYLRDGEIPKMKLLIDEMEQWCKEHHTKIEMLVNDWGMMQLLKGKEEYFSIVFGVLLNKMKKDARYQYKNGYQNDANRLRANNLLVEEYTAILEQKWNVRRYEFESCGHAVQVPKNKSCSFHLPFYQTNTSQYCPLRAITTNYDRGKQRLENNCPKDCERLFLAYPEHLKVVGRFNSIFGFDDSMLVDWNRLEELRSRGIDRIVMNYM